MRLQLLCLLRSGTGVEAVYEITGLCVMFFLLALQIDAEMKANQEAEKNAAQMALYNF